MSCEPCYICDGTGTRDWLSGAKCYECNGLGYVEDSDPDDDDEAMDYVSPEDQAKNDAMERAEYQNDRDKDERAERRNQ